MIKIRLLIIVFVEIARRTILRRNKVKELWIEVSRKSDSNQEIKSTFLGIPAIAKDNIEKRVEIERRRKMLKSGDEYQRINAVLALGELGDTDSIHDLIGILQSDASSKLRGHAAYALGRLDAYEAIPALRKGLEDEDDFVQRQCARALRRLGEEVPEIPKESFMQFAHQMGGPMQAIRSDVGYLLKLLKEEGKIDKNEQEQLEAIDTHATRLGVMLDNLTYANLAEDMEHEEYLFSKNSISALIQRAARQFKFVAQYRGIDIRIDDSIDKLPPIEFDRDAIFTVFVNLIDNAVKFSYPNNVVDIAGRTDNHSISITISDFGIGISEGERDKIFNLYYRGRKGNAARYTSGSGLGLFVAKKIIKEHGGEIFVSSENGRKPDGQRVAFTVKLPVKVGETIGENTVYRK
ncbi:MAG: ATP-binding protein [Candidatus Poribacteria bacterium]